MTAQKRCDVGCSRSCHIACRSQMTSIRGVVWVTWSHLWSGWSQGLEIWHIS